jgi:uracil DNA glycosylase
MLGEIEKSWKTVLQQEFQKKYFVDLLSFLDEERAS